MKKTAPFPAGRYREKTKQKGSGDCLRSAPVGAKPTSPGRRAPLQVQKIGRFCASKEAGFWAFFMKKAVLASLLHSRRTRLVRDLAKYAACIACKRPKDGR